MPHSLKCKIKHLCHNGTITESERDRILKALEREPKTGHWFNSKVYDNFYICSECSESGYNTFKYCPNCGVKMESEDV